MFCNYCGSPNPEVASFCMKCGKAIPRISASEPAPEKSVDHIVAATTPSPAYLNPPPSAVLASPVRQETFGILAPGARTEFIDGLTVELRRQIDDKCFPASLAAGIVTLIAFARFSIPEFGDKYGFVFAFAAAFVVAGLVFKIAKSVLENKHLRPIADMSDEMLVTRYNEAKADRRAARTRTAISWGVIAIIAIILVIAWLAARR
jgi:hypothetical protein